MSFSLCYVPHTWMPRTADQSSGWSSLTRPWRAGIRCGCCVIDDLTSRSRPTSWLTDFRPLCQSLPRPRSELTRNRFLKNRNVLFVGVLSTCNLWLYGISSGGSRNKVRGGLSGSVLVASWKTRILVSKQCLMFVFENGYWFLNDV